MRSGYSGRRTEIARRMRAGFTLIELMVVILIIAILAALLLVGVLGAKTRAEEARTIVEIDQMAQALEAYRSKYGDYPPIGVAFSGDSNGPARVQAHVLKAFQRFAYGVSVTPPTNLDPAESLVYWLGGVPIGGGTARGVEGFAANVANPFQGSGAGAVQRVQPFFTFDSRRLVDLDGDGYWEFVPHGKTTPYVYFRSDLYGPAATNGGYVVPAGATGAGSVAVPYMADMAAATYPNVPTNWVSPNAFQIIAAGSDDFFGASTQRVFPTGQGYNDADNDNLANFSRTRLEAQKP